MNADASQPACANTGARLAGANVDSPDTVALARACQALWAATLSLMAAFMHNAAPAHRYLIARRIARNLETLRRQECFTAECRTTFARLSQRWDGQADRIVRQQDGPRSGLGIASLASTRW